MHLSPYNVHVERPEGQYVYNGVSGAVVKVSRRVAVMLQAGYVEKSMEADDVLVRSGIVTADPQQQMAAVKNRYTHQVLAPTSQCTFVISPTTKCNLCCPYCYEHTTIPDKATMTRATARRVVRFICREMDQHARETVFLKFYGGEPLLRLGLCRQIVQQVGRWSDEHGKRLISWIQTNGTLITEEMQLETFRGLSCVEITFDGSQDRHDQVRIGHAGSPTFERIVQSIHLLAERRVAVSLRINLHSAQETAEALHDLEQYGVLALDNVSFYDGQVSDAFAEDKSSGQCVGHVQTEKHLASLLEVRAAIRASGWSHKYQYYPLFNPYNGVCSYAKRGNFCIDPAGDLYSCVFQLSREEHRVGTILEDGTPQYTRLYDQIMFRSPFAFDKCVTCAILPQCWGGCFAQCLNRFGTVEAPCCGTMLQIVPGAIGASIQERLNEALEVQRVRAVE